jgi:3-mercaptopyruvate sulfurtransferase SseA
MAREISAVLEYGAPEPGETATMMEDKLHFHTDSWDLSADLRAGLPDIVVIDARSRDAYAAGHMPGAVSFPHREMCAAATAQLDRSKVYVDPSWRISRTSPPFRDQSFIEEARAAMRLAGLPE